MEVSDQKPIHPQVIDCFLEIYKAQYPDEFSKKKIHVFGGKITVDSDLSAHTEHIEVSEYLIQQYFQ